ncbi:FlgD immunoglobulin-like domain containing protein, partial [Candidatus Eisenbacteria bacterium]
GSRGLLIEKPIELALLAIGHGSCQWLVSQWNGYDWYDPGSETPDDAFGRFDAARLASSDMIHLVSHPRTIPDCPCWALRYFRWRAGSGWLEPTWFSGALSEWYICVQPSVTVDLLDRPVIAYVYHQLDDLTWAPAHDYIVIARRTPGVGWEYEYREVSIGLDISNPVIELLNDEPMIAWSGLLNGAREIFVDAPLPLAAVKSTPFPLPASLRISPNPSNASVHLLLASPAKTTVTAEILDVTGRQLRTLVIPQGHIAARWDGRNDSGELVRSGIYHARVLGAGVCGSTTPVVRVR